MKTSKYIYIDDEKDASIESLIHGLNDTGVIQVELLNITADETFDSLTNKILHFINTNHIGGILIDLCLNGEGVNRLNFNAAPVAQHIRSLASDRTIENLPIILCSTDEKLRRTYNADKVSHDLYDYKFVKDSDIRWNKVVQKMSALADGYRILFNKSLPQIVGLQENEIQSLDSRIFDRFQTTLNVSSSELANLIVKDLFQHPGVLINERHLAARLGIDIDESSDWDSLLSFLNSMLRYNGVFSDGWNRFWSHRLDSFFQQIAHGNSWVSINAEERVKIIAQHFSLTGLKAASPIRYSSSSYYDTICEYTKKPLDSMEGYEIYESYELRPWQDPKYISFFGIAKDDFHESITVKESEMKRFQIHRAERQK